MPGGGQDGTGQDKRFFMVFCCVTSAKKIIDIIIIITQLLRFLFFIFFLFFFDIKTENSAFFVKNAKFSIKDFLRHVQSKITTMLKFFMDFLDYL